MPFEFEIVETIHTVDQTAEERSGREAGNWHPLTAPMDARSREGWELVDVDVSVTTTRNKYDRVQKVRTVITVWRRPVPPAA